MIARFSSWSSRLNALNFYLIALVVVLVISICSAWIYVPFLNNRIIFDDHNLYTNLAVYHFAQIPFDFRSRTFPYFTLGFVQVIFDSIRVSRAVSLVLHISCAALLFALIRTILNQGIKSSSLLAKDFSETAKLSPTVIALIVALWFAINPVAVYGAGYLIQRTILFATLFSLLSLWYFRRSLQDGNNGDLFIAALFYSLAVFSKEHAIMLPAAALPLLSLYREQLSSNIKKAFIYLVLCTPAALKVFSSSREIVGSSYEPDVTALIPLIHGIPLLQYRFGEWLLSCLMQATFFLDYLYYWLIPDIRFLSIDMRIDFGAVWQEWWFFPKVLIFFASPIACCFLLRRRGLCSVFACGFLYSWIIFLTELVAVRIQEPFVLYRSYIWAPGYALMLAAVIRAAKPKWVVWGMLPIGVVCIVLARERLASMANEGRVWNDAAYKLKSEGIIGSGRIFYNRGRQYLREKEFDKAISDFSHTINQNPQAYYSFYHRGTAYFAIGQYGKAMSDLDRAMMINKNYGPIQYSRGQLFEKIGCIDEAIHSYSESLRLGVAISSLRLDSLKNHTHSKKIIMTNLSDACHIKE